MRKTTTFERKVVAKLKQNQKSKAYSRAQAESHKLAKDTFNGALMQNSERGRRTALREREIAEMYLREFQSSPIRGTRWAAISPRCLTSS